VTARISDSGSLNRSSIATALKNRLQVGPHRGLTEREEKQECKPKIERCFIKDRVLSKTKSAGGATLAVGARTRQSTKNNSSAATSKESGMEGRVYLNVRRQKRIKGRSDENNSVFSALKNPGSR